MILGNDEKKRSRAWRHGMAISSILIILIAAFFIVKMFTSNPLEGKWSHEDSDLELYIKSDGNAIVEFSDQFQSDDVKVTMPYTIDMDTKTIILRADEAEIEKAAEKTGGAVTEAELSSEVNNLEGSYEYNIENDYMTLSEREYGEQMVFEKE